MTTNSSNLLVKNIKLFQLPLSSANWKIYLTSNFNIPIRNQLIKQSLKKKKNVLKETKKDA